MNYLTEIWDMAAEAAPWLLFGLFAAALVKALVPTQWISKQLGSSGVGSVLKGALMGIPLPLCSCGVLPTAMGLRRQGAGKPATVAFLVSTPEIGLDSFLLSFALLGPFMAITRPIAAFCSAVIAGLAAMGVERHADAKPQAAEEKKSCCCSTKNERAGASTPPAHAPGNWPTRIGEGLHYVFTTLWDDVKLWLAVAVVIAGVAMALTGGHPAAFLQQWGSGPAAKLIMLAVGIPLYICATASTPIAAALLVAGVSPGTVLVLLLAGPATNIGSIVILRKELGTPVLLAYLLSIAATAMGAGLIVDAIVSYWHVDIITQAAHASHLLPHWFGSAAAVALIVLAITPLRNALFGMFAKRKSRSAPENASAPVEKPACCRGSSKQAKQPSCH
ncbi:MAG: SO_0444 family Cu/Zn efflux transporter [Phycisphaerales bacterium]